MADSAVLLLQHNSMQFSDSNAQHKADADAVFKRAKDAGVMFVTGTESGGKSLNAAVKASAAKYGFKINAHKWGDWVAVNTALADVKGQGYAGPMIQGTKGLKASQGAHAPRGVSWMTALPKNKGIGLVTVGSCHYLTNRSTKVSGSNAPLIAGIGKWGKDKGKGKALVFVAGDVNLDDSKQDVFRGQPFTTIWDELKKWPATLGKRTIDVIASYDQDGRVSAKSGGVITGLKLNTDHKPIQATYSVRLLNPAKKK